MATSIRHIGTYEIPIQFDQDLRTEIQLIVEPDQALEEREEMEFDDDGELIEKPAPAAKEEEAESTDSESDTEVASA